MLKWSVKALDGRLCAVFIWLTIGKLAGCFEGNNENLMFQILRGTS